MNLRTAAFGVALWMGCSSPTRGEKLLDQLCACADRPCAERVSRELIGWSEELRAKAAPGEEPPELARFVKKHEQRYYACHDRALGNLPGTTDGTIKLYYLK
ncbi:MAG: hypothetical protein SFX73_14165 [Kofleriaceae bacterium]|nr:hypothetical protein [Kofleriaceae bacterium]